MARWAQVVFIVICFATIFGLSLWKTGSRSLEKLNNEASAPERLAETPSLRVGAGRIPVLSMKMASEAKTPQIAENVREIRETAQEELEIREAKQSVLALLEENKRFRKEVLDLEKQIRRLTHSLAKEKLENDRLRVQIGQFQDRRSAVPVPGSSIPEFCEIIDVNEDLNLVVLDRGSEDGIQHRMQLAVVREGSWVARLEAVNVRSRVTGATIKILKDNETIVPGDRVVPWQ